MFAAKLSLRRATGVGRPLLAAAALLVAVPAGAFEGTVTQRVVTVSPQALKSLLGDKDVAAAAFELSEPALAQALKSSAPGVQQAISTIQVKGRKFRVEMTVNDQPATLVTDAAAGTSVLLLPQARQYVDLSAAERAARTKAAATAADTAAVQPTPFPAAVVKALNRKGRINGELSEEYEAREGDRISIGWVAAAHPDLLQALRDAAKAQQTTPPRRPSPMEIFSAHGLPMLVRTVENGAYEQTDLARIVPGTLSDALFAVPEGYTKAEVGTPTPAAPSASTPAP